MKQAAKIIVPVIVKGRGKTDVEVNEFVSVSPPVIALQLVPFDV